MKHITTGILALVLAVAMLGQPVLAKKWTLTQREVQQQHEISSGERSGELTKKEADNLRSKMSDISSRITKMKGKNGGKLSYKDQGKIEKDLNSSSIQIQKLKLQKRVTVK